MQKRGITDFVSHLKACEKLQSDFEKLAPVIQHGLLGFIGNNIEGESTEASDLMF